MNHKWTPEADARLAELYPKQKTADIAHAFRTTTHAINQRAWRIGVTKEVERTGTVGVMLTLPPHMHKVVTSEAGEGGVSVAAVVRRILAAHYQIEDVPLVNPFKRNGGKRKGAGRKPATPRVYQAPSMPFVRIGRD